MLDAPRPTAMPTSLPRPFPTDRAVLDRYLEAARAATEESAWDAAGERGRHLAVEEAVEYALGPL